MDRLQLYKLMTGPGWERARAGDPLLGLGWEIWRVLTRAKHKLITADLGSDRLQLAGSSHTPIIGPRHTAAHLRDSSPSGLPLAILPFTLLYWLYWSLPFPVSKSRTSPRQNSPSCLHWQLCVLNLCYNCESPWQFLSCTRGFTIYPTLCVFGLAFIVFSTRF